MNEKVESLLCKLKEDKQQSDLKKRNEHLIQLGLFVEAKDSRIYQNYYSEDCLYDEEKQMNYKIGKPLEAITVSDAEYEEICKYDSLNDKVKEESQNIQDIVKKMAMNVGTIKSIIVFFAVLWVVGVVVAIIGIIANS